MRLLLTLRRIFCSHSATTTWSFAGLDYKTCDHCGRARWRP